MSDEPLPGDWEERVEAEELTQEQRAAVVAGEEIIAHSKSILEMVRDAPAGRQYDSVVTILLSNPDDGVRGFGYQISDSVHLQHLLGCLEIIKSDIIEMLREAEDMDGAIEET